MTMTGLWRASLRSSSLLAVSCGATEKPVDLPQQEMNEWGKPVNSFLSFQTAVDMSVADESRTGVVSWVPTDKTWIGSKAGESDEINPLLAVHLDKSRLLMKDPP